MDQNSLAELGAAAAQIPVVSAIVQPTINQFKAAFDLSSKQTLITAYCLSIFLMMILAIAFDPGMTSWVPGIMAIAFAKTLVAGWLAATIAGMTADSQKKTDAVRQMPPSDVPEIVAEEPVTEVQLPKRQAQAVRVRS